MKKFGKGFNLIFTKIADIFLYFGLYIPLTYIIFAGSIVLIFKIPLNVFSAYSFMFYFGLFVSVLCPIFITIKKLRDTTGTNFQPTIDGNPPNPKKRNKNKYAGIPMSSQSVMPSVHGNTGEIPYVYPHAKLKGLICVEYSNRIEYFGVNGKQLIYLRTHYKEIKRN